MKQQQSYKEWLAEKISYYEDLKLFGDLSKEGQMLLDSYKYRYEKDIEKDD